MKKVLLLLIAFVTGVLQAAAINWGNTMDGEVSLSPGGGHAENYVAYLCVGDMDAAQQAVSKIKSGTWSAPKIGQDGGAIQKKLSVYDGVAYIDNSAPSFFGSEFANGAQLSFYVVVFDESSSYFMVSNVQEGTLYAPPSAATNNLEWSTDDIGAISEGWQLSSDVPEPTVLALLALGVAGLALKRRTV